MDEQNITTLDWSPNGNYLATATTSGQVCIWDVSEKEIVAKYQNAIEVSGLSWHPTGNVLAFVCILTCTATSIFFLDTNDM